MMKLCDRDIARKLFEQGSHFWTVFDSAPFDIAPPHPGISRPAIKQLSILYRRLPYLLS